MKEALTKVVEVEYRGRRGMGILTYREGKGAVVYAMDNKTNLLSIFFNPLSDHVEYIPLPRIAQLMRIDEEAVIETEVADVDKSPFKEYKEVLVFTNHVMKSRMN